MGHGAKASQPRRFRSRGLEGRDGRYTALRTHAIQRAPHPNPMPSLWARAYVRLRLHVKPQRPVWGFQQNISWECRSDPLIYAGGKAALASIGRRARRWNGWGLGWRHDGTFLQRHLIYFGLSPKHLQLQNQEYSLSRFLEVT